jgi:ATP/maltotriose-dependent transcriptional regulator MalT
VALVDSTPSDAIPLRARIAGIGNSWSRALRLAGLLDEAEREAHRCVEQARDAQGTLRSVSAIVEGLVLLDRGFVRTAIRAFRDAAPALPGSDPVWDYLGLIWLVTASGMLGEARDARAMAVVMEQRRHPSLVFREPDRLLARAWVAAAEGATTDAVRWARAAADDAAAHDASACEVVALHTAVCFGDRNVADRLARLVTIVDGPRAPAAAAHAAALAKDDGQALEEAAARLEDMGALLFAADAAAQAAAAHERSDKRIAARASMAAAHRLQERCEGASTPALRSLGAAGQLTAREREVVSLAAIGMDNRAIAERLVVSVRTIEGHLYRAAAKLGTADRRNFAALLKGHHELGE